MQTVRVGFVLGQVGWLGGVNYFRNLLSALQSFGEQRVQPVVFAGMASDVEAFTGLAEIIRTPMLDRLSPRWALHKLMGKVRPGQDWMSGRLFRQNRIDLVFHFGTNWRCTTVPSLGWIPDFQHLYYPKFFSEKEYLARDAQFDNITERCSALLFSSHDALNDLKKKYPRNKKPAHVLQFVSSLCPDLASLPSRDELARKYRMDEPWFHVPNQFWAHKNHTVIIDALNLLKASGRCPLIVSTGKTDDYRNTEYFPALMRLADQYGVSDRFLPLGIVPYEDVVALMLYSVAVINPSLFEGWSTSVEESKALGKKILLSDIPVHREQAPARGHYFAPHEAEALAAALLAASEDHSDAEEDRSFRAAQEQLPLRRREFAHQFEDICLKTVVDSGGKISRVRQASHQSPA